MKEDEVTAETDELRNHRRAAIPLLIQYRFSPFENYRTDYSADISAGGLFLSSDDAPANVATILLRFLPRDGSRVIHAQGEIVRRSEEGLAVRFIHIDEQDQSYVDALVSHELD
ncbi:MAG: hypothetical protein CMH55_05535 [Myxococcales bacterium]|nr:hypothetical protein [Myxococcales bacterium]|tara:strand:+ start:101 stop:442 length:342 start_codon:yes stop_codon:yes gene_type:complete